MRLTHTAKAVPGWLLASALALATPPASSTDAFNILDRMIDTYAKATAFRTAGTLVSTTSTPAGISTTRYQTEVRTAGADSLLLRFRPADPAGEETVVWRERGVLKQWSTTGSSSREISSVGSSVVEILGPAAVDAMLVPLLLARDSHLIAAAEAVTLDGTEPCGDDLCDVLIVARRAGQSISRLHISQRTHLLHRLEFELLPPARMTNPELAARQSIMIDYDPTATNEVVSAADVAFSPPEAATSAATPLNESKEFVVSDEISVALRSLTVRAVDPGNRPIRGLKAADFSARLGREEIEILSADWISSRGPGLELLTSTPDLPPLPMAPRDEANGNLIVLFIQADFNSVRAKGHLRMLPLVKEFLRTLDQEDWVAVVSFDSHLKLWLDFTRDRTAAGEATDRAVRFGALPPIQRGRHRSLAYTFPSKEAQEAATPEDALRLTARSLIDIPGEKVIVYLGWGLGRYGSSGFRLTRDYNRALATLDKANASVFVLDVTDADYHTLELGIRQIAQDTGGTYAKTDKFARREVLRLAETISGYYLLTLDESRLPNEVGKLELRLTNGGGRVILRDGQLGRK
jgi:hypothetical protein